jgi:glucosamine-6-phosphate deaminase
MNISISSNAKELGVKAAQFVTEKLMESIRSKGEARLLVSTGSSQFETIEALIKSDLPWDKIDMFHLDEYINLEISHKASFRKYLNERFVNLVNLKNFYAVSGEGNIQQNIATLTEELKKKPVDVGLIGIGENAHIAFNDPPANFDTRESYRVVTLDDRCKMQQVNEGWFPTLEEVPKQAISMTVWQIMQCKTIVSCVPHQVKANAIKNTLANKLTNEVPSTMLKEHADFHLYLDRNSASGFLSL